MKGGVLGFKNVYYSNPQNSDLQITGSIDGSGQVTFKAAAFGIEFNGTVEPGGLHMTGSIYDCAGTSCRTYGERLDKLS